MAPPIFSPTCPPATPVAIAPTPPNGVPAIPPPIPPARLPTTEPIASPLPGLFAETCFTAVLPDAKAPCAALPPLFHQL